MTTTIKSGAAHSHAAGSSAPFARTGQLLRFMIRRDRIWLSLWTLGIGAMAFYVAHAVQTVATDQQQLVQIAALIADPVGRMMTGPGFGMDAPTYERFFSAGYVLFIYILVALMSIFLMVRHTRAEEQTGRSELVRANVVGRHATLTATFLLAVIANFILAGVMLSAAITAGFAWPGSVLVAVGSLTTGVLFTAIAAVAVQISETSRGANALAGSVLAAAYVIRMGGDMPEAGGTWLSWLSPLAWPQQAAPYVFDRWWPLTVSFAAIVVMLVGAYALSVRRDHGASLTQVRPGRPSARPYVGTPIGMSYRILRGNLRGWAVALFLAALMFGGYAEALIDAADGLPEEIRMIMPGEDMMLGYLAYMSMFLGMFIAAAGVTSIQVIRSEEARGRAEFGLSAPISRTSWLGSHMVVQIAGLVLMLVLSGFGTAVGASAVLGHTEFFTDLLLASVHQFPAVLTLVGVTVALFGWAPRFAGPAGWLLVVYAVVMENFGAMLDVPEQVLNLSPFHHLASYPVEDIAWTLVVVLTAIGVAGIVLGLIGWRRREVNAV